MESQTGERPNVLIIGDSISMGYTPHVTEIMDGEALVEHHEGNGQHTGIGLKLLDEWLGETKWDVIHFNWGLHDLCYKLPNGERDCVNGKQMVALDQYAQNLNELVVRLKRTGAALIWASTTIVPDGATGRFVGDESKYNDAAAKVMQAQGIPVDDLYALSAAFTPDMFIGPADVHYSESGYRQLAEQVAESLRAVLARAD
jgi:GDSL-like Lipase/Acylhydrolase